MKRKIVSYALVGLLVFSSTFGQTQVSANSTENEHSINFDEPVNINNFNSEVDYNAYQDVYENEVRARLYNILNPNANIPLPLPARNLWNAIRGTWEVANPNVNNNFPGSNTPANNALITTALSSTNTSQSAVAHIFLGGTNIRTNPNTVYAVGMHYALPEGTVEGVNVDPGLQRIAFGQPNPTQVNNTFTRAIRPNYPAHIPPTAIYKATFFARPNTNSVWQQKTSSMFPTALTPEQVVQAINQANANARNTGRTDNVGTVNNLQVWEGSSSVIGAVPAMDIRLLKFPNGRILTAYPLGFTGQPRNDLDDNIYNESFTSDFIEIIE